MSWYRRLLFRYKGKKEWTRQGYETASANFNPADLDVDCSGRHFIITGSNSGIGLETALEVARRGGILHMVCRNNERAQEARSQIITSTGNDKITVYTLDLEKPRDVAAWAKEWSETHDQLNVLIHNAGCMNHERRLDQHGIESNFATNVLAVHILTRTLVPLLQKSEDARVIMVSSGGMFTQKLDPLDLSFEKMNPFDGAAAYSQNKRQQVVLNLCYAQLYDKVHFSCMHPGWADTVAVRTSIPEFYEAMKDVLRTPAQGADTVVWLAVSQAATKHPSGFFFQDRSPCPTHFPLAWTRSTAAEEDILVKVLDELLDIVSGEKQATQTQLSGNSNFYNSVAATDSPKAEDSVAAMDNNTHPESLQPTEPHTEPISPSQNKQTEITPNPQHNDDVSAANGIITSHPQQEDTPVNGVINNASDLTANDEVKTPDTENVNDISNTEPHLNGGDSQGNDASLNEERLNNINKSQEEEEEEDTHTTNSQSQDSTTQCTVEE